MLHNLTSWLPASLRLAFPVLGGYDKTQWETEWQRTQWLPHWRRPEIKAKAYEYWRRYRHLDEILQITGIDEKSRVLDVGCGLSTVLYFLPGDRYGIDPLAEHYKSWLPYPEGITVNPGFGEALLFADKWFDIGFCSNCIDHTEDAEKTISEIERVLVPGGHFVLTCEVFDKDLGQRNIAHPQSITSVRLHELTRGFTLINEWVEPWYGLRRYTLGKKASEQHEHVLLLRKS